MNSPVNPNPIQPRDSLELLDDLIQLENADRLRMARRNLFDIEIKKGGEIKRFFLVSFSLNVLLLWLFMIILIYILALLLPPDRRLRATEPYPHAKPCEIFGTMYVKIFLISSLESPVAGGSDCAIFETMFLCTYFPCL